MQKPRKLKVGDKIGIICTSTPIDKFSHERIQMGYRFLEYKGLTVIEHPQCRNRDGYKAGSIKERVNGIHEFVDDPSIKAIMSFWGGANTNEILEHINYDLIEQNPKIFVGYSDTTAFLQAITQKTRLITYVGPSVITFTKPYIFPETWDSFDKLLFNNIEYTLPIPQEFSSDLFYLNKDPTKRIVHTNEGIKTHNGKDFEGQIVCCNLSVLSTLAGTEYFPDLIDKILFTEISEEVGAEEFDRLITHMYLLPTFKNLKALVISKFMEKSNVEKSSLMKIFEKILHHTDIPIIYNFDCGHTDPILTIPNGGYVKFDFHTKEMKVRDVLKLE